MSYGANQYRRAEASALSPRETEAAAFAFVNRLLSQDDPDNRMKGLVKNQQLWSLLIKDVALSGNGLHDVLKSDLSALSIWVMRQTIGAMGDPGRSVRALIEVNDDMIGGLRAERPSTPVLSTGVLALAG